MLVKITVCISANCLMFFVCVITVTATSISDVELKRYEVINDILNVTRHNHSLPPGVDTESVTNVSVEIVITDLNYESDIKMEYECTLYLHLNWTDERLDFTKYNTSYDSLKLSKDIMDKIWIPDLFFSHERESELDELLTKNQLAYIFKKGTVVYSGRFKIKLNCHLNLSKYPFETQRCPILIQSYAFTKDEILLYWNGEDAVKIKDTRNMNFTVKPLKHTYSADSIGNFSTLLANISFKRPQESFLVMYVVPPIILVAISFTSFLLGDNVESRIIVPTGVITQLIMQWAGIYNKLPPVSVLIQLDRWMLTNLVFVGLVLIVNAVICHFVILKDKEAKGKGERKNENDQIELESKGPKQNDNVLEDSRNGMPASSYTSQRQQQQSDERSRLIRHEPIEPKSKGSYGSIERKDDENSDGRSQQNKGFNKEGIEMNPINNNNERNEPQDYISQAVDNKTGCLEKLKRRLFKEKENKEKKREMKERKTEEEKKNQKHTEELEDEEDFDELLKDNEGITTTTKLEDVQTLMEDDPRFVRALNRNMVSEWYQRYIDKKKKEDFQCLLKERVKKNTKWKRAEKKIDHDPRYCAVDASTREQLFQEFQGCLCSRYEIQRYMNVIGFLLIAIAYIVFLACFLKTWSQ